MNETSAKDFIRLDDDGRVEKWGRQLTPEERQRDLILTRLNEIVSLLEEIRDQRKERFVQ